MTHLAVRRLRPLTPRRPQDHVAGVSPKKALSMMAQFMRLEHCGRLGIVPACAFFGIGLDGL